MALAIRGNRAYEYRSIRRAGKVTSQYLGAGGMPAESAAYFRHQAEVVRRQLAVERVIWAAERRQIDQTEAQAVEVDAAYHKLATVALLATGHHRPQRGRWRRRRAMANKIETKPSEPTLISAAEMGELLDQIERAEGDERKTLQEQAYQGINLLVAFARDGEARALPALRLVLERRPGYFSKTGIGDFAIKAMAMSSAGSKDVFLQEVHIREIQSVRDELAGPSPNPLDRLLCERVALTWFDANQRDISFIETTTGTGCSIEKAEYYSRQRDRANARFLAAAKALATVRRLAMPVLHVHREATPPPPVVSSTSLRLVATGSDSGRVEHGHGS